ncbi:MAG: hypothetical protein GYB33_04750 [Gammaproteobacteria bacterium]|nr:hypothetical protein [Gammaproteobacteria bacterium]
MRNGSITTEAFSAVTASTVTTGAARAATGYCAQRRFAATACFWLIAWLALACLPACSTAQNERPDPFPTLELNNDTLRMVLYLPDRESGFYRGTRFDWSGMIERVEYAGHRFYQPFQAQHNPYGHDHVSGPAEEFGMDNPPGFDEAAAGEIFMKIGVGLLRKGAEPDYRFNGDYELVRAGDWAVARGPDWVEFEQALSAPRGWGYRYQKRIQLLAGQPAFTISHRLENSGSKTIATNHYNHNFTLIDGTPYGPDYDVQFPFLARPEQAINEHAWFRTNGIEVQRPLGDASLWLPVHPQPGPATLNAGLVRNNKTGAAVRFQGDTPISKYIFWAVERAACPEPFIHLQLAPGQVQEWSTLYTLEVDSNQ